MKSDAKKQHYFSATENYSLKTSNEENNFLKQDLKKERKWALIWGIATKIEITGYIIMLSMNAPKPLTLLVNAVWFFSLIKTIEHIYDARQMKKYFGEYLR